MKIVGIYSEGTKRQYFKLKSHLALCVVGVPVDTELFVSTSQDREEAFEKYNVDTVPAFIVVDSLKNPIASVTNSSARDLEELAVTSGKRLKV